MNNKFKLVIPSYNNETWSQVHVESILEQDYKNYDVLYIDDCSTDKTRKTIEQLVNGDPRWTIVTNNSNMRRGYNISPINPNIQNFIDNDEDILVFVDGDDWLAESTVLTQLNDFYNKNNYWMSYGGYVDYPELTFPGGPHGYQNTRYPKQIQNTKSYRKDWWRASHLRTFKWWLYKQIKDEDLRYSKTGEYYFHAEDLASSFPCLEMCPPNKIGVHDFVTYVFNNTPSNRARGIEREKEAGVELETEIRNQKSYDTIEPNLITCKILGEGVQTLGLGNQLFSIASTLGTAYDNNAIPVFNIHTPQFPYKDNILRNLKNTIDFNILNYYKEPHFHYKKISYTKNMCLDGYFQSEKYFKNHRKKILEFFKISENDYNFIQQNFKDLLIDTTVSLHIRRGDYTLPKYSSHHPVQTIEYYHEAMSHFSNNVNYLIFSDDIDWAKENFSGDNFNFITQKTIQGNDVMDTLDISKGGYPDYIELYLMSLCDHNIIANSSFSWWGAWLNENPNKKVIAPKKWFGPAYGNINDTDIIPNSWIRI
tara:strand:+ start:652 stop:2262 length:1611 start_codon:yes stop_codon:yes gene_type:complete